MANIYHKHAYSDFESTVRIKIARRSDLRFELTFVQSNIGSVWEKLVKDS